MTRQANFIAIAVMRTWQSLWKHLCARMPGHRRIFSLDSCSWCNHMLRMSTFPHYCRVLKRMPSLDNRRCRHVLEQGHDLERAHSSDTPFYQKPTFGDTDNPAYLLTGLHTHRSAHEMARNHTVIEFVGPINSLQALIPSSFWRIINTASPLVMNSTSPPKKGRSLCST